MIFETSSTLNTISAVGLALLALLGPMDALWAASANNSEGRVLTTIPDFAVLTARIGGKSIVVDALLSDQVDPHYVDASPSFTLKALNADMVVLVGMSLESSWLQRVLQKTGKTSLQPQGRGYCDVGERISVLEKPTTAIDRSMGDVHPEGNPHYWLSFSRMGEAAKIIADCLAVQWPAQRVQFHAEADAIAKELEVARLEQQSLLARRFPQGVIALQYHQEFSYLFTDLGITSLGSIEEKPGVPPSAARLIEIAKQAKERKAQFALAAMHSPQSQLKKFSELSGVPSFQIRTAVSPGQGLTTTIELLKDAVQKILDGLKS
jgi:zinc/manganese transport system substrate-binding protein